MPVLDPGRGRTKTGRLWVYAREQRPWGGPEPPAALYLFAPDRKAERPASHLEHFKGVLHVDGYAGFEQLASKGDIVLAACWSHARRKFYDVAQATHAPIAIEALRRIGELYAVEADIRTRPVTAAVRLRCSEARWATNSRAAGRPRVWPGVPAGGRERWRARPGDRRR